MTVEPRVKLRNIVEAMKRILMMNPPIAVYVMESQNFLASFGFSPNANVSSLKVRALLVYSSLRRRDLP
jgi:hypothetical protein